MCGLLKKRGEMMTYKALAEKVRAIADELEARGGGNVLPNRFILISQPGTSALDSYLYFIDSNNIATLKESFFK
jgi:hypothetical protein